MKGKSLSRGFKEEEDDWRRDRVHQAKGKFNISSSAKIRHANKLLILGGGAGQQWDSLQSETDHADGETEEELQRKGDFFL